MNVKQLAKAFAAQGKGSCHNATVYTETTPTLGGRKTVYRLHGHAIAELFEPTDEGRLVLTLDWCGYYTVTTANHLGKLHEALGLTGFSPSYATARKAGTESYTYGRRIGGSWYEVA